MPIAQMGRLMRITRVFVRHDLDELVRALHLFRPLRFGLRLLPWRWFRAAPAPRAQRLREALEELGPIFVKFGQMLSTRPDLLPEDIALELNRLQDRVPPYPGEQAIAMIEQALGGRLADHLQHFDPVPVASASVAQVHFAELADGTPVAVKVLRPGVERVIERDLALIDTLARLAERYWPAARRFRPREVVDEYRKTIHGELDLMREASNASRLRANFAGSELLYVPKIYWDLTRPSVMVMERVGGIPISNIQALKDAGIDMRRLAHHGVEIFFTQAFRDGFFHADMHPGNIFVSPEGQYRAVDFGIMGTLSERDKHYLAENFLAFFNRDYRTVAESHVRAGWVARDIRLDEFEAAIRAVCEPIFARPLKDISFGRLLMRLFQTARRFDMEVQPQLVLLQKTLFNIEGLGRRLYPDLDLWETAKPYLERWTREQFGPAALLTTLRRELPRWWRILPETPGLVYDLLRQARVGDPSGLGGAPGRREREPSERPRRWLPALGGAGLLVAGALLLGLTPGWLQDPARIIALAAGAGIGGGLVLTTLAWARRNS
ncbi:MAG TPA: ubiquinone biosynthesis regulatory protein kinase UbiB [Acidiferrobacterales bacterium]|jgi:ubiquinone biosynthesis protein